MNSQINNTASVFGTTPSTIRRVLLADGWHTVARFATGGTQKAGWSFEFDATGEGYAHFLDEDSGRWVHTRPSSVVAVEEGTDDEQNAAQ